MKRVLAITLSSVFILFGVATSLIAAQDEYADLNDDLFVYHSFNENANEQSEYDGTIYINILKEDKFGGIDSAYAGSPDGSERWNYSSGNIMEVNFKSGKIWWSFLPAKDNPPQ